MIRGSLTDPGFKEVYVEDINKGTVSCCNCRHFRVGIVERMKDSYPEELPVIYCNLLYIPARSIAQNIRGKDMEAAARNNASNCTDYESMIG